MDKVILINKEQGYTSRDIVNILTKKFNTKKIGHFGTLDPLATGLLVIGIGKLTKIGNYLEDESKEYIAEVLVGTSTDTYDITGNIIKKQNNINLDKSILNKTLQSFKKTYMQEVPIYSAVKVNGKKLYEYARANIEVNLPFKSVTIYDINLIDICNRDNNLYFKFLTHVSKGTYIRSLINDISKELNIPLCMSALIRTKQGKFSLNDASTLKDIENNNYKLLDIREVIPLKEQEIEKDNEKIIFNGGLIPFAQNKYILFTKNNKDIVLYGPYKDSMKPYISFYKN